MNLGDSKQTRGWICLALALVTIGVYSQVIGFDFVNYDDPDYVTANKMVRAGLTPGGIIWAFTHFYAGNWHPLTWISHMLDCQIFGEHAGWHHLVNVLLHAANAVLLFILLERLTGARWRSALVAALFALHPLHVESVAWIAERKDVLSTFFGLLSLLAYVESSKFQVSVSRKWFLRALVFFALSLLSKPMLVTLPFVMLLLDFWPLQRVENIGWRTFFKASFGKLALEKWPWFALSLASSVITFIAQKSGGAVASVEGLPFSIRLANAIVAYLDYIIKTLWPFHLTVFYPLAHTQPANWVILAAVFLAVIPIGAVMSLRRRPYFFVGWFWFLGTLVPVIGLVQVGSQAMADRYTYVPHIGLFIAAVWGLAEGFNRLKLSPVAAVVGTVVLIFFASVTIYQLQYWRDSFALFNHALAITTENAPAHNNLGTALAALGKRDEALAHYQEAVRLQPGNALYQNNLATAFLRAGHLDEAIEHYHEALRDNPKFAEVYSNLGSLFLGLHRFDDSIANFNEALRLDPENGETRSNLGNALLAAGRLDEALAQYLEAVRLSPDSATVHLNAGLALLKANRASDATMQFSSAVRLNPASAEAHYEFGRQLFFQGNYPRAWEELSAAANLKPNYATAQFYSAASAAELGHFDDAIAAGNQALASAQQAGQTNLATRIQEALEFFKQRKPLSQAGGRN